MAIHQKYFMCKSNCVIPSYITPKQISPYSHVCYPYQINEIVYASKSEKDPEKVFNIFIIVKSKIFLLFLKPFWKTPKVVEENQKLENSGRYKIINETVHFLCMRFTQKVDNLSG